MYRGQLISSGPAAAAVARQPLPLQGAMDVEFLELSDLGKVREGNEDYFGHVVPDAPGRVRSHGWLFVLADGVGGQDRGEVASHTAVDSVVAGFREAVPDEPH